MNRKVSLALAGALLASLGMIATDEGAASARTVHASSGTPANGSSIGNFSVSGTGVSPIVASGAGNWFFPLVFDNPGARTITVRGRLNSGSAMGCAAAAVNTAGAIVSSSPLTMFSATGSFTTISLDLSSVPGGSQGLIVCAWSGTGGTLLGTDYNP